MRWVVVDEELDYRAFDSLMSEKYRGLWYIHYDDGPAAPRGYLVSIWDTSGIRTPRGHQQEGWYLEFMGKISVMYRGKVVPDNPVRGSFRSAPHTHDYLLLAPGMHCILLSRDPYANVQEVTYLEPYDAPGAAARWLTLLNQRFPCPECQHYWPDSWNSMLVPANRSHDYAPVLHMDCCRLAKGNFDCCDTQRTMPHPGLMHTCGPEGRFFKDRLGSKPPGWRWWLRDLWRRRPRLSL